MLVIACTLLVLCLPCQDPEILDIRVDEGGAVHVHRSNVGMFPEFGGDDAASSLDVDVDRVEFLMSKGIASDLGLVPEQVRRLGSLNMELRQLKRKLLSGLGPIHNASISELRDIEAGVRGATAEGIKEILSPEQAARVQELRRQAQFFKLGPSAFAVDGLFAEIALDPDQKARLTAMQKRAQAEFKLKAARLRFAVNFRAARELLNPQQLRLLETSFGKLFTPFIDTGEEE